MHQIKIKSLASDSIRSGALLGKANEKALLVERFFVGE
jgi:hypothetical protein